VLFINGYAGGGGGPPVWDATQKNQFVSAGNPGTVTAGNQSVNVGTVRYSSTSQFPSGYQGNGSLYSDGNGHYFYFTGPKNQRNFKFGTKDFCVEGWWNADRAEAQKTLIDFRSNISQVAFALKIDTSNRILFVVTNTTRITSAPITLGQTFHVAIERVSGVTTLYINGLRSGVTYSDTNDYIAVQDRPVIFTDGTSLTNESFVGNMQIMRVTKDYPRYSANFSPGPTAIFDTIGINQTYLPYI
jgi:ribosomal protein L24E